MNPDQINEQQVVEQFAQAITSEETAPEAAILAEPPEAPANNGWQRTSKEEKHYQRYHGRVATRFKNGEQKRRAGVNKRLAGQAIRQAKKAAGGRLLTPDELGLLQESLHPMLKVIQEA